MLTRLCELAAFFLDFVEQADVLDRDRGLVGKCLEQRDVLVFERTHLGATDQYRAQCAIFAD